MRLFLSFFIITLSLLPFSFQATTDSPQISFEQPVPQLQVNNMPSLADLLTIESSASIFYSYARELTLSQLLSEPASSDQVEGPQSLGKGGLTLLVPTNKAVMALARKPHQGPPPKDGNEDITISEEEFYKMSKENVQRWVEAHIIPTSPLTFPAPTITYDTLLQRRSVSFTSSGSEGDGSENWQSVTVEENVRILNMKQASNGVLYLIDGTIKID